MNTERLLTLATYLDTVDAKTFDLDVWKRTEPDAYPSDRDMPIPECGFVACAVGHACGIPEFQSAGLHMRDVGHNYSNARPYFVPFYTAAPAKVFEGWSAVEQFFGINNRQAEHLFDGASYGYRRVRPTTVANKIRRFVEKEKAK